jgi:hypothetical protein
MLEGNPFAESDPTGRDAHSPGAKLDNGKPRVELVLGAFAPALLEVAKVGTYGANKYTENGWLTVPDGVNRYDDAEGRHRLYRQAGELRDRDTGLLHRAHAAWNALAALTLYLQDNPQ